ncbi:hypothetical protein PS3A_58770 [Pseudomonas sp. 3A(2025)]
MSRKQLSPIEKAHWESRARSHVDVKDGVSACPLMGKKVQLIPVRYGRVERLHSKPDGDRYADLKRPLGLRLVRDGYLYVIDEDSAELHEYRLDNGRPVGLLWQGTQVTQDIRLEPGGTADLIFSRDSLLHVAWSPIQWTAAKCNHLLNSSPDRYYFMQQVHLAKADCEKGGQHLRVESQIKLQLAEIAEQPAPQNFTPGMLEQEKQDYHWEDPPLFREAHIGELKQVLNPLYENDHLYLLLEDSLGIIGDLADEQDKVVEWISHWREAHDNEQRYVTASYIDTLMTVGEHTAQQTAGSDSALLKKTTPDQRTSIYAWINARNNWRWETSKGYPAREHRFDAPDVPVQTRLAEQEMTQCKYEMIKSLGDERYNELKNEIEALEDSSKGTLNGIGLGARGIHDLVRHEEMQGYLKRERAHLKRWQQLLEEITEDRTHLLCSSEFHRSTWYFDTEHVEQMEQALVVEQNCMRDLCRTEESMRKVGEFFHQNPHYILPVFQGRMDFAFLQGRAGDLIKWLDDIRNFAQGLVDANSRVSEIDRIMNNHWSRSLSLPPHLQGLHQAVLACYIPAIARDLSEWMSKLQSRLDDSDLSRQLKRLTSATNRAHRLGMLVALQTEGIVLKVATQEGLAEFRDRVIHFNQLIDREEHLRKKVEKLKKQARQRGLSPDEKLQLKHAQHVAAQELLNTRNERAAVRRLIEESIEPTNTLPKGYIQIRLEMSDAQRAGLQEETRRMQAGMRGGYATPGAYRAAFKSSWAPLLLGTLQIVNLGAALKVWRTEEDEGSGFTRASVLLLVALTGATASTLTAYQLAHISMLDRAMQEILVTHAETAGGLKAVRIGKLGLGLGGSISLLPLLLNMFGAWNNYSEKWRVSIAQGTTGEKIGAWIGLSGDLGAVSTSAMITSMAAKEFIGLRREVRNATPALRKLVASQAWATRGSRFLSFSARLNIWGLAFLALQMAGEAIHNYYHLDDLQRWLSGCLWGKQPQNWSEADSTQKLAESTLRPTVIDQGIVMNAATNEPVRSLHLILPGMTPDALEIDSLRWKVIWICLSEKLDVSDFFRHKLSLINASPLTLELKLPPEYLGHQVYLDLCLAVKPSMAENFLKFDKGYLNYHFPLSMDTVNKPMTAMALAPDTSAALPEIKIAKSFIDDQQ